MSDANTAAARRAEFVAALKEERRGYEVRGLADRVKQVDEALAAFGEKPRGRKQSKDD